MDTLTVPIIDEAIFKLVPKPMRNFVQKHAIYTNKLDGLGVVDLDLSDILGPTFYFPEEMENVDDLASRFAITAEPETVNEYVLGIVSDQDEAKQAMNHYMVIWEELKGIVEDAGYSLQYSHDMNVACYGYWDVLVPIQKWSESVFLSVCKAMTNFDEKVERWSQTFLESRIEQDRTI